MFVLYSSQSQSEVSKNSAWPTILKSVRNSQKVRFRFQWYVIPILIPIPGFPKYFDSDSDSDSSGLWFWFRFRGFPNIIIPTPIPILVVHDSDSDSDSRVSQISLFCFRFRLQCHIVLIPIPIPTYQVLILIPIPESDSDSGIIYNSGPEGLCQLGLCQTLMPWRNYKPLVRTHFTS